MGEKIFTKLEALARWVQLKYMQSRRTTEIVEPGRVRFHPQDAREWIMLKYKQRLKELKMRKEVNKIYELSIMRNADGQTRRPRWW